MVVATQGVLVMAKHDVSDNDHTEPVSPVCATLRHAERAVTS